MSSDGTAPLIFINPLSQTLKKLKEVFEENSESEGIEIFNVENLDEAAQLIPTIGQAVILISSPKNCALMLQANKRYIKSLQTKTLLLTPKALGRKTLDQFMKIGLTECIVEPVNPKTLLYKVRLQLRSMTSQESDRPEMNTSFNEHSSEQINTNEKMHAEKGILFDDDEEKKKERGKNPFPSNEEDSKKRENHFHENPKETHYKGKSLNVEKKEKEKENSNQFREEGQDSHYKGSLKKEEREPHSKSPPKKEGPSFFQEEEVDDPPKEENEEENEEENKEENKEENIEELKHQINLEAQEDHSKKQHQKMNAFEREEELKKKEAPCLEDSSKKRKKEKADHLDNNYRGDLSSSQEKKEKRRRTRKEEEEREEKKKKGAPFLNRETSPPKSSSHTENKKEELKKSDAHSERIKTYYSSKSSLQYNREEWARQWEARKRERKKNFLRASSDVSPPSPPKDLNEESIDYRNLKKQFESLPYDLPSLKENSLEFEAIAKVRTFPKTILSPDGNVETLNVEEVTPHEQENSSQVFVPESKGIENIIEVSNFYFKREKEREREREEKNEDIILSSLSSKIALKFKGDLTLYSALFPPKKDSQREKKVDLLHCGYPLRKCGPLPQPPPGGDSLSKKEYKKKYTEFEKKLNEYDQRKKEALTQWKKQWEIRLEEWTTFQTPAWRDHTFQEEENEFIFPFYEGEIFLGLALFTPFQKFREMDSSSLEVSLEAIRALMLTRYHKYSQEEKKRNTPAPSSQEMLNSSKKKKGLFKNFFHKLTG